MRGVTRCKVGSDVTRSLRACMRARRFVRLIAAGVQAELSLACATHLINFRGTGTASGTGPSGRGLKSSVGKSVFTSADPRSSGSGQNGARGLRMGVVLDQD